MDNRHSLLLVAFAYGCLTTHSFAQYLFWSRADGTIMRSDLNGNNAVQILSTASVNGIVVDPIEQQLYIAQGLYVQRAQMDGSNLTLIGSSTASYFVRGIDLDPFRRELFYSSLSVFRRHYLDSGVISILGGQNFMGGYPSYLGLYLPTNKLLWLRQFADPGPPDRLDRANLDSNNIESLVTGSYDRFAVDPVHHWVFIIGANSSIVRISLHTLDTVDLMTVPSTEALAVDPFSGKVYWTEPDEGRIMRMDLDGQNAEIVVSGQSAPEIVAVFNPIDCDGNSVSDWCDISCGLPGGPCNVPGCGGGLTVTATVFLIPAKLSPIAI